MNPYQVALGHAEREICLDGVADADSVLPVGVEVARGYGHPKLHEEMEGCSRRAMRKPAGAFVPPDVEVGAVRISVTGWEGWVVEGLKVTPA